MKTDLKRRQILVESEVKHALTLLGVRDTTFDAYTLTYDKVNDAAETLKRTASRLRPE